MTSKSTEINNTHTHTIRRNDIWNKHKQDQTFGFISVFRYVVFENEKRMINVSLGGENRQGDEDFGVAFMKLDDRLL